MWIVAAIFAVGVPTFVVQFLRTELRRHRTDLLRSQSEYEGASRVWQVNVLRRSGYDDVGRRLLNWYILCLLLQGAGLAIALWLLYRQ